MNRKRFEWKIGSRVIFNDMGNWGFGRIDKEGEESESSRWFWVAVEQTAEGSPIKTRRLLRGDDLCSYQSEKWKEIADNLERLSQIRAEKRRINTRITQVFEEEFQLEEDFEN